METVVDVVDSRLTGTELLETAAAEVTWVVGEYTRALAHAGYPLADDAGVRQVFTADPVNAYLCLARTGHCASSRPPTRPRAPTTPSGIAWRSSSRW
ncbi:hypothetical protein ACWF9B_01045 [Streptomyces sp. NPDC055089]